MPNLTAKEAAEALLPCPFCGGSDIQDRGAPGHYSVQCACHRGGFETRLAAREKWNTRTPDPQVQVLQLALAEAEGAIEHLIDQCSSGLRRGEAEAIAAGNAALETIAKVKG